MRRRLSLLLTFAAWLFATGSQWDLVQTFAWGRMFATNLHTMSVVAAVKYTFTPEDRCSLCAAVAEARQQEAADTPTAPDAKVFAKILLVCGPVAHVCLSPAPFCAGLAPALAAPVKTGRAAPPTPPPRALA